MHNPTSSFPPTAGHFAIGLVSLVSLGISLYQFVAVSITWYHLVSLGITWYHLVSELVSKRKLSTVGFTIKKDIVALVHKIRM